MKHGFWLSVIVVVGLFVTGCTPLQEVAPSPAIAPTVPVSPVSADKVSAPRLEGGNIVWSESLRAFLLDK